MSQALLLSSSSIASCSSYKSLSEVRKCIQYMYNMVINSVNLYFAIAAFECKGWPKVEMANPGGQPFHCQTLYISQSLKRRNIFFNFFLFLFWFFKSITKCIVDLPTLFRSPFLRLFKTVNLHIWILITGWPKESQGEKEGKRSQVTGNWEGLCPRCLRADIGELLWL